MRKVCRYNTAAVFCDGTTQGSVSLNMCGHMIDFDVIANVINCFFLYSI